MAVKEFIPGKLYVRSKKLYVRSKQQSLDKYHLWTTGKTLVPIPWDALLMFLYKEDAVPAYWFLYETTIVGWLVWLNAPDYYDEIKK